jgi:hypothetical protein
MKKSYRANAGISKMNLPKLELINGILDDYRAQGLTLTLRQLYYQMVARDHIPNNMSEYKKIINLCTKGRMGGLIDWDSIEDRLRRPRLPRWSYDMEDALVDTARYYRLDRMKGQEWNIEVWLEKEALSAIVGKVTSKYHVNLMVNRGYSSCTAMRDAHQRFERHENNIILYMGDHDPSGLDMIRDVYDRVGEFIEWDEYKLKVKHIALTMDQIEELSPPPNFAKVTDSRARHYIGEYGNDSWEIDAIEPQVLSDTVENHIKEWIDLDMYEAQLQVEKEDKANLRMIAENYKDVIDYLNDTAV